MKKRSFFAVMVLSLLSLDLWASPIYFPRDEHEKGLLNIKDGMVSLGVELETLFISPTGDDDLSFNNGNQGVFHNNRASSRFSVDKLTLIPRLNIDDKIKFYAELEALTKRDESEDTFFREAHLTFFFPRDLFLKIGLDDRLLSPEFMALNNAVGENKRLTEVYPILGTAFWQDEDVGLTLGGDHAVGSSSDTQAYWRISITNGLSLAHQELTVNQIYPIIQDDRDFRSINLDISKPKEWAFGAGFRNYFTDQYYINFFGFSLLSKLAAQDMDFLNDVIAKYTARNDRKRRTGLNAEFNLEFLNLFAQYIVARDGDIEREGFYLQPSLYFSTQKRNYLNAIRFLYRFNYLDVFVQNFAENLGESPFTWNRRAHSIAVNIGIHKFLELRNEVNLNKELTGGHPKKVLNNEFITQLELHF